MTVAENSPAAPVNVLANDVPGDLDTPALATTGTAAHGTVSISGGAVTYTPKANYCGNDTFSYVLQGGDPADVSVMVTCVAPETRIGRRPTYPMRRHSVFRFRSSLPGSTFTCQLDHADPKPCKAPKDYRNLEPGRHTFKVFATSPPVSYTHLTLPTNREV